MFADKPFVFPSADAGLGCAQYAPLMFTKADPGYSNGRIEEEIDPPKP